jgi:hypothetical protein
LPEENGAFIFIEKSLQLFFADIFVPDFWMGADIVSEEIDAFGGVEIDDFDSERAQPIDAALKIAAFAYDNFLKTELADKAAAIPAGSERGDHNEAAVAALAAGIAEGIGFTVKRRIAELHAAVVTRAEENSFCAENCGADGDAAFRKAFASLRDGDCEEGGVVERLVHAGIIPGTRGCGRRVQRNGYARLAKRV